MKKFCYVSIISGKKLSDAEIKLTTKYRKCEKIFKELKADGIITDAMNGHTKIHTNLFNILLDADIIILPDISCLGSKKELEFLYNQILGSSTGIYVCDNDELSTVDKNFKPKTDIKPVLLAVSKLTEYDVRKYVGVQKTDMRKEFVNAYWQVELGEKTEKAVLEEIGIAKNTFRSLIETYEKTKEYTKKLLNEEKKNEISKLIKKYGNIPDENIELFEKIRNNEVTMDEVEFKDCIAEINFKRFYLKYLRKKKNEKLVAIQKKRYHEKKLKENEKV